MADAVLDEIQRRIKQADHELKIARAGTRVAGDKEGTKDLDEVIEAVEKVNKKFGSKDDNKNK